MNDKFNCDGEYLTYADGTCIKVWPDFYTEMTNMDRFRHLKNHQEDLYNQVWALQRRIAALEPPVLNLSQE